MNFENKISSQGIHYSRYIASYMKEANKLGVRFYFKAFKEWLMKIGLSEQESYEIACLADNGKLELEVSAMVFLTRLKKEIGS